LKKNEDKTIKIASLKNHQPEIIPGICPVAEKICIATMNTVDFKKRCIPDKPKIHGASS
jgi:hypothetical protein